MAVKKAVKKEDSFEPGDQVFYRVGRDVIEAEVLGNNSGTHEIRYDLRVLKVGNSLANGLKEGDRFCCRKFRGVVDPRLWYLTGLDKVQ